MPDKIVMPHSATGSTLYVVIFNSLEQYWNGSAFEDFVGANWSTYVVPLTERTVTMIYRVSIPDLPAGNYGWIAKSQAGGSPATTDPIVGSGSFDWDGSGRTDISSVITHGDANWSTIDVADVSAAVLTTPANKIDTTGDGEISVSPASITAIVSAVWGAAARTLTAFDFAADIATAVWASGTRTLSSFGSLAASVATAVWASATRTLSAFGFTVTETNSAAIKAVTDKLNTALELDGSVYRLTTNALEQAPSGGDATAANQTAIIDAIAALAAVDAATIAEAVMDATVDGALDLRATLKRVVAVTAGKCVVTDNDPLVLEFYNAAGDTVVATLTLPIDSSGREAA